MPTAPAAPAKARLRGVDVLWSGFGVEVALGRAEPRVPEEGLDEVRAGLAGDERSRGVAQRVEAKLTQPS